MLFKTDSVKSQPQMLTDLKIENERSARTKLAPEIFVWSSLIPCKLRPVKLNRIKARKKAQLDAQRMNLQPKAPTLRNSTSIFWKEQSWKKSRKGVDKLVISPTLVKFILLIGCMSRSSSSLIVLYFWMCSIFYRQISRPSDKFLYRFLRDALGRWYFSMISKISRLRNSLTEP